ncbi:hypothetical protein CC78DRAFT_574834 [Lojkania enalia]|uniref:Uncharacterized protein n=1 Tax=Lojkania enalia TaxID=147567 RepID=A0A9P4TQ65_9PLEO|nr:hypothetical protein CC78DRAFT_574834 [Didymosphaeria enalia]
MSDTGTDLYGTENQSMAAASLASSITQALLQFFAIAMIYHYRRRIAGGIDRSTVPE